MDLTSGKLPSSPADRILTSRANQGLGRERVTTADLGLPIPNLPPPSGLFSTHDERLVADNLRIVGDRRGFTDRRCQLELRPVIVRIDCPWVRENIEASRQL